MIVKDLVEARELMIDEVKENVVVVYELFDNADCHCEGVEIEEFECDPEEIIQILSGCSEDSLTCIKEYHVGEEFATVDDVLQDIRINYSSLLKA
ncbi:MULTISPECIES: hypothetical protein [Bacillaceae]|uniref:Uncharacterized protein n=1 Tax=Evansella alkalicola TaxID=745819 RepID=A0ABS6JZN6_9BACI|nr:MULTISPECIES: hypothetical protein [Bacillaceae]MBU9724055.1 hypothetical protein [Bacillus alkalicola]